MSKIKIVAMSDTHLKHRQLIVPAGDILIHGGDALNSGGIDDLVAFANWYGSLPHKHKIYVPGNHDRCLETSYALAKQMLTEQGVTILIDEEVEIDGLRIYGTPWTPTFRNWSFMGDETKLERQFANIPEGLDLLVSHGPPKGYLDSVTEIYYSGTVKVKVGSKALAEAVKRAAPKHMLVGHIHSGQTQGPSKNGNARMKSDKKLVLIKNISVLGESYQKSREPIVLELEPKSD